MTKLATIPILKYPVEKSHSKTGLAVTEAEYWNKYYENSDHNYEWNDGYLEEKFVSDKLTTLEYEWFFELLRNFLRVHPDGEMVALETGFRLVLPHKTTIRKPDLGVILYSNPVPWQNLDNSYHGICDLCVEALSDSDQDKMERDTVTKFSEYAQAGVKEYYILYAKGEPMNFYHLSPRGVYVPIKPIGKDVIRSKVLPGFQFRISDLSRQPSPEEMSEDMVYQNFMLPALREAKRQAKEVLQRAQWAERQAELDRQQAELDRQRAQWAEQRAESEQQRADAAEAEVVRLMALLHKKMENEQKQ